MREDSADSIRWLADKMTVAIDEAYRVIDEATRVLSDCESRLNPYQEPAAPAIEEVKSKHVERRYDAKSEAGILKDIRHALNQSGRVRVIRNTVGFDQTRNIRYGLGTGSPDLIGPLRNGRIFAVEVKTTRGRMSVEQCAWWMAARKWGVTGGVATSVESAMALLDDAAEVKAT